MIVRPLTIFIILLFLFPPVSSHAGEKERKTAYDNYHKYNFAEAVSSDASKVQAVGDYRKYFAEHPYRKDKQIACRNYKDYLPLICPDGTFSDLDDADAGVAEKGNSANSAGIIIEALDRIWSISEAFRNGTLTLESDADVWDRCQKAILHYGGLEICRPNDWRRFHSSCFAIPTAAVNIYFCFLEQMDAVEQGQADDRQLAETCEMLKMLGLQAWTQPFRNDVTDNDVVSLERFRNHVWWVGGNALGYRSLLPVAFMLHSVPMLDLLSEVCRKAISVTSQNTYETSFWNEGFTADGAGWGHGKQCLIWGYPIDGTLNALNQLSILKGSPWEKKLSRENVDALFNYFRGSNWYYYKGYTLPCLDRNSMSYKQSPSRIRYTVMLEQLIGHWGDSFTADELAELKALYDEALRNDIVMTDYDGSYNGTRWFYNNDDLVKKNGRYHIMVNMSSSRCDGIESAPGFADEYNFYTTDGSTLFQKTGDEYRNALGAFDVTAFPGVTAREGMDRLEPVTNWRGYTSCHNFAAGATLGGENAVAGYIFEKMNASDKDGVNDRGDNHGRNAMLYGVRAYKSYFMLGDYMVCLGAGVSNLTPEIQGNVRTTMEQTEKKGDIYGLKGKKGVKWIVHEGKFAYSAFPEYASKVHWTVEKCRTDWVKRNGSNRCAEGLPETVDMFRMWFDHGRYCTGDTYGYAVYAGEGLPAREYPFEVLRNDTSVQAVRSSDSKVVEAVFYDPSASLKSKGLDISVSHPCALLLEKRDNGFTFAVTDALMDASCKEMTVTVNGIPFIVTMPSGEHLGQPAVNVSE